jgi:hypothetical protein
LRYANLLTHSIGPSVNNLQFTAFGPAAAVEAEGSSRHPRAFLE